jgi:hypothetical protein
MGKAARLKRRRDANEQAYLDWTSSMCGGCAYRRGTEANTDTGDPGLARKRELLLEAGEVFYCHEPCPAGVRNPYPAARELRKACVGHMHALNVRYRRDDVDVDRARQAVEEFKQLDAAIWTFHCGWNVKVGELCPNPEHGQVAAGVAKVMESFR